MPREVADVRSQLMSLSESDFDPNNSDACGIETLNSLCDDLRGHSVELIAPVIFEFIEKFADPVQIDARWDLGTPGPLVHTLESLPGFEVFLLDSLRRRPAPLSVWMLNRLLNALPNGEKYERCFDLLRSIRDRADASRATASEAAEFLDHQTKSRIGKPR